MSVMHFGVVSCRIGDFLREEILRENDQKEEPNTTVVRMISVLNWFQKSEIRSCVPQHLLGVKDCIRILYSGVLKTGGAATRKLHKV